MLTVNFLIYMFEDTLHLYIGEIWYRQKEEENSEALFSNLALW